MRRIFSNLLTTRSARRTSTARHPRPLTRLRRSLSLSLLEDRSVPATFTVNLLSDDGSSTGANSGDLRYCMTQAQEGFSPGADVINFDPTMFSSKQTILLTSVLPTIDNQLTITGTGSAKVVLDLNNTSMTAPFTTDAAFPTTGAPVNLTGFTMQNANSTANLYVTFKDANATLTDVIINNGVSSGTNARDMEFTASNAGTFTPSITLTNCSISGTTNASLPAATGLLYFGGPVFAAGVDMTLSGTTINNNKFTRNNAVISSGPTAGALDFNGNAAANGGAFNTLTITNSTISGNSTWYRGAVYVHGSNKSITVTGSHIDNNIGGIGAGLNISGGTPIVTITRSQVSGNSAGTTFGGVGRAGGIYLIGASTCTIDSSSIVGNQGIGGGLAGGVWADNIPAAGLFHVINSTFANNTSSSSGGAIRVGQGNTLGASFVLENSTFYANKATNGDAIRHFNGTITVNSCIFDGNFGGGVPNIADFDSGNPATVVTNTLYNPNSISPGTPGITTDGTDILNTPSQLNPAADNGAGLLTCLPAATSPVINKGSNPQGLAYDQRGSAAQPVFVRSYNGGVDMGAIEAVVFSPFVTNVVTDGTITTPGVSKYNFNITYADNAYDINVASIHTGNITVTGKSFPGGINATWDHNVVIDSKHVQAFYYFNSPGATFVPADNGPYALKIAGTAGNQVTDTNGGFVPAGTFATATIAVSQTFTVTTTSDVVDPNDGVVSLREAIIAANTSPATDFIGFDGSFASPQTISLALGAITVSDATVINNPGGRLTIDGGGTSGIFSVTGTALSINNLSLVNGSGQGGALNITSTADMQITNCTFDGNKGGGSSGGAIYNDSGPLTISKSTFSNNSSGLGGAIYLRIGLINIDSTSFVGNTSTSNGGAIDCNFNAQFAVNLTITNSTLSGNSANGVGGAIFINQNASFVLRNSTVSGNSSSGNGGGLYVLVTALQTGSTIIQNSTITQNVGGNGAGGLSIVQPTADPINITSTILAGNTLAGSPDYRGPTNATFSKSLLGVANSFTPDAATLTTGGNLFGSDATPLDPNLAPLLQNGAPAGAPFTHALLGGSPAIDAGSNPAGLTTDERGSGHPRQVGAAVDIGAYEGVLLIPVGKMTALGPIVTPGPTPNQITVTYTDDIGIKVSTIDPSDIQILDPSMVALTITSVLVDPPSGNGTPRVAHYTFTPPVNAAAGWDASDNGTYTVLLPAGSITDTEGDPNVDQNLGTFKAGMPFVYTVINADDFGAGSGLSGDILYCVNQANSDGGPSFINFDPTFFATPQTIMLTAGALPITDAVTITGPTVRPTIDGLAADRIVDASTAPAGAAVVISNLIMTDGAKTGSNTVTMSGGAILIGVQNLTLNNCVVSNSTTQARGGGIGVSAAGGQVTLNDCVVSGNKAIGGPAGYAFGVGGGIGFIQGAADSLVMNRTTVSGNSANFNGGGVYFAQDGSFQAKDSTISGNTAAGPAGGGGMYFFGTVGTGGFLISNSTLSGNNATGGPGGGLELYFFGTGGAATIQNSTITANNSGVRGGGLGRYLGSATGTVTLSSTIVAGNSVGGVGTAATADIGSNKASTIAGNNNLIGIQDAATLFTLSGTGNQTGTTGSKLDAKLGPLALNGVAAGKPMTHALLAGSPASNAGNNTAGLSFDERGTGFNRVSGGTADVGAFEVQVATPPPTVSTLKVGDGTFQRSMVTSLTVTFSEAVTFSGPIADAFLLNRNTAPPAGPGAEQGGVTGLVNLSASQSGNVVTLTFLSSGANPINAVGGVGALSLPDGRYTLTIDASKVNGAGGKLDGDGNGSGGDSYVVVGNPGTPPNLFRFFGDVTGDGSVSASDFNGTGPTGTPPNVVGFRQAFGGPDLRLDYNNDGAVAASDFTQFRFRFGGSVP